MKHPQASTAVAAVTIPNWQLVSMLLVALLLLAACSAVQPRRNDPAPCAMGGACDHAMIEHAEGYRLGYLQFGDDGRYAQPGQAERVLADFAGAAADGLILVGFTHGWKEDSGAARWSVGAFKAMLTAIAERERRLASEQARAPRLVAGVFLGWPGRVTTLPGLNGLTWFDRVDAAERIARGDFGNALLRLRALRDSSPASAVSPRNQLILVGHSLGATMLYQRLAQEPLRSDGAILTPVADLVLLLSPAIPAADIQALAQLPAADQAVLPPVLAITSAGDVTLRIAFPLAEWLDNGDSAQRAEGLPRFQAMGTYAPLVTHRLEVRDSALSLTSTGAQPGDSSLLQIAASEAVMRGHKDIANPRLVDFIAGVAALQLDNRFSRSALAGVFPAAAP